MEDAECYKSPRAWKRSGTVMRMQYTAGTILAALLTRFEWKFIEAYTELLYLNKVKFNVKGYSKEI